MKNGEGKVSTSLLVVQNTKEHSRMISTSIRFQGHLLTSVDQLDVCSDLNLHSK